MNEFNAVNFNLYETDLFWEIEIVASNSYNKENDDWACDERATLISDLFVTDKSNIKNWKVAIRYYTDNIKTYLESNSQLEKIKIITIGFVDGDLKIIKE